jgi:hypothetical protein
MRILLFHRDQFKMTSASLTVYYPVSKLNVDL